ncbi:hypothetical protein DBR40_18570 [Pedobacter sp. KBW01]|nr:hypothetical protein DBR40_18570 [Pedobacter sp. KBW01]
MTVLLFDFLNKIVKFKKPPQKHHKNHNKQYKTLIFNKLRNKTPSQKINQMIGFLSNFRQIFKK